MMDAQGVIVADAALTADFDPIVGFLAGYIAILAIPGPNMLSVGAVAALRGFRTTVPLCLGIAFGAGSLGALLFCSLGSVIGDIAAWQGSGRVVGALLLLCAAALVMRRRPAGESDADARRRASGLTSAGRLFDSWSICPPAGIRLISRAAVPPTPHAFQSTFRSTGITLFCAGFCTSVTNPVTAAFFAAQFFGPMGGASGIVALRFVAMVLAIVATALVFSVTVAGALASPVVRRATIAHYRPIQMTATATLLIMAVVTIEPLLIAELGFY